MVLLKNRQKQYPMLRILPIVITFLFAYNFLIGQEPTKKTNRIIEKQIEKIWNDKSITQLPIDTKVALEFDIFFSGNLLYELKSEQTLEGYLLVRRGYGCKIGGCDNAGAEGTVCSADGVAYEYFDYALLFDSNLTVLKVLIIDYPGEYGYEITSKGWLKQFIGYNGAKLYYGKDIDAISGATISANSITSDIVEVHKMLHALLKKVAPLTSKN